MQKAKKDGKLITSPYVKGNFNSKNETMSLSMQKLRKKGSSSRTRLYDNQKRKRGWLSKDFIDSRAIYKRSSCNQNVWSELTEHRTGEHHEGGGHQITLSHKSFLSQTVNQATLQPLKDLTETGFILKAHSSKITSKLTPKDSPTIRVGINETFKSVIESLYVIIPVNRLEFQNCHMHCI